MTAVSKRFPIYGLFLSLCWHIAVVQAQEQDYVIRSNYPPTQMVWTTWLEGVIIDPPPTAIRITLPDGRELFHGSPLLTLVDRQEFREDTCYRLIILRRFQGPYCTETVRNYTQPIFCGEFTALEFVCRANDGTYRGTITVPTIPSGTTFWVSSWTEGTRYGPSPRPGIYNGTAIVDRIVQIPALSVAPDAIDFGLSRLHQPTWQTFAITNTGEDGSVLRGIVLTPNPPFSITGGGGQFSLSRGESQTVEVQFLPTDRGMFNGNIRIISNDPRATLRTVSLRGEVRESCALLTPCLQVSPLSVAPSQTVGSSTATLTIISAPNTPFTLEVIPDEWSGGHDEAHQANRPQGTLSATSGQTGPDGRAQVTYTAPVVGGGEEIVLDVEGGGSASAWMRVAVPGLALLREGKYYTTVGGTRFHHGPGGENCPIPSGCPAVPPGPGCETPDSNHWGTELAIQRLIEIAEVYEEDYPGLPEAEWLRYNDMSLPSGGLFDICGTWQPSHLEHRGGINADVSDRNVPRERWEDLEDIFKALMVDFEHEFDRNHWHLEIQ